MEAKMTKEAAAAKAIEEAAAKVTREAEAAEEARVEELKAAENERAAEEAKASATDSSGEAPWTLGCTREAVGRYLCSLYHVTNMGEATTMQVLKGVKACFRIDRFLITGGLGGLELRAGSMLELLLHRMQVPQHRTASLCHCYPAVSARPRRSRHDVRRRRPLSATLVSLDACVRACARSLHVYSLSRLRHIGKTDICTLCSAYVRTRHLLCFLYHVPDATGARKIHTLNAHISRAFVYYSISCSVSFHTPAHEHKKERRASRRRPIERL